MNNHIKVLSLKTQLRSFEKFKANNTLKAVQDIKPLQEIDEILLEEKRNLRGGFELEYTEILEILDAYVEPDDALEEAFISAIFKLCLTGYKYFCFAKESHLLITEGYSNSRQSSNWP